jgi:hypothetical protein
LQCWLNAANQIGKLYPDLNAGGNIGRRNIVAVNAFLATGGKEGESVLFKAIK